MNSNQLKKIIRDVPDFPKEGIIFKDITTLLKDPKAFKESIDLLIQECKKYYIDKVIGIESRPGSNLIVAEVPLAETFGYATDLRSSTQGRATFTTQFSRYKRVPASLAGGIISKG